MRDIYSTLLVQDAFKHNVYSINTKQELIDVVKEATNCNLDLSFNFNVYPDLTHNVIMDTGEFNQLRETLDLKGHDHYYKPESNYATIAEYRDIYQGLQIIKMDINNTSNNLLEHLYKEILLLAESLAGKGSIYGALFCTKDDLKMIFNLTHPIRIKEMFANRAVYDKIEKGQLFIYIGPFISPDETIKERVRDEITRCSLAWDQFYEGSFPFTEAALNSVIGATKQEIANEEQYIFPPISNAYIYPNNNTIRYLAFVPEVANNTLPQAIRNNDIAISSYQSIDTTYYSKLGALPYFGLISYYGELKDFSNIHLQKAIHCNSFLHLNTSLDGSSCTGSNPLNKLSTFYKRSQANSGSPYHQSMIPKEGTLQYIKYYIEYAMYLYTTLLKG